VGAAIAPQPERSTERRSGATPPHLTLSARGAERESSRPRTNSADSKGHRADRMDQPDDPALPDPPHVDAGSTASATRMSPPRPGSGEHYWRSAGARARPERPGSTPASTCGPNPTSRRRPQSAVAFSGAGPRRGPRPRPLGAAWRAALTRPPRCPRPRTRFAAAGTAPRSPRGTAAADRRRLRQRARLRVRSAMTAIWRCPAARNC